MINGVVALRSFGDVEVVDILQDDCVCRVRSEFEPDAESKPFRGARRVQRSKVLRKRWNNALLERFLN